jgi:cytochrome b/uncharacterized protein GlcG (DUF336 family)
MVQKSLMLPFILFASAACGHAAGGDAMFAVRSMSVDTAGKAAWGALEDCRRQGYSVAVAVVDRGGNVQILLRDRFAGPHTPETAVRKAWTANSFRQSTGELAGLLEEKRIPSQVANNPGALLVGGGLMIQAAFRARQHRRRLRQGRHRGDPRDAGVRRVSDRMIRVWDVPLRLFHWLLAAGVAGAYVSGELGGLQLVWHIHFGALVAALLAFRIAWGFAGSSHARFASFAPTPARLRRYLASEWVAPGHTPLAGLAVIALLLALLVQVGTGLFAVDDELCFGAPLYDLVNSAWNDRLTYWHGVSVNMLLALVGLHLVAVGAYAVFGRRNLLAPMFTGRAHVPAGADSVALRGGGPVALALSLLIAGAVFGLIELRALNP